MHIAMIHTVSYSFDDICLHLFFYHRFHMVFVFFFSVSFIFSFLFFSESVPLPPPNPLLRAADADGHVQVVLSNIRTPELDEALLVLPFEFAIKLIHYLDRFITKGVIVELATHALLFLLKAHHVSESTSDSDSDSDSERDSESDSNLIL